jgi:hypothetical protein
MAVIQQVSALESIPGSSTFINVDCESADSWLLSFDLEGGIRRIWAREISAGDAKDPQAEVLAGPLVLLVVM